MLKRESGRFESSDIQLPTADVNRICDLRHKEVINLVDGGRLGFVKDVEYSLETGRILSIVLPGPWSFFSFFGKETEMVIPWKDIRKIGDDIVLVEIHESRK